MTKIKTRIENDKIVIVECIDRNLCESLRVDGYIKGNEISPLEALYQATRSTVQIEEKSGWDAALRALEALGISLGLFLVYQDLRRRGKRVRPGFRENALVFERDDRLVEVIVLEEGKKIRVERLVEKIREIQASGREVNIAIVDESGTISYYHGRLVKRLS